MESVKEVDCPECKGGSVAPEFEVSDPIIKTNGFSNLILELSRRVFESAKRFRTAQDEILARHGREREFFNYK